MKQLIIERVKIVLTGILVATLFAIVHSSCTTMRKDCHGIKHQRLSNGIHLTISPPFYR